MISDLWSQINDLRSMISNLWSQIYDLRSRSQIYDLRSMISDPWSQIYDLRSMISDLWFQIYDLISMISDLWYLTYDLRSMNSDQWSQNNDLRSIISYHRFQIYDLRSYIYIYIYIYIYTGLTLLYRPPRFHYNHESGLMYVYSETLVAYTKELIQFHIYIQYISNFMLKKTVLCHPEPSYVSWRRYFALEDRLCCLMTPVRPFLPVFVAWISRRKPQARPKRTS